MHSMDFSEVVIENMRKASEQKYSCLGWTVVDMRELLKHFLANFHDIVVDKESLEQHGQTNAASGRPQTKLLTISRQLLIEFEYSSRVIFCVNILWPAAFSGQMDSAPGISNT